MSERGHTPGPWTIIGATEVCRMGRSWAHVAVVSSPRGNGDSAGDPVPCRVTDDKFDEAAANAKLICAAPDLLDACKAARAAIGVKDRRVLGMLEKAISKAEGLCPSTHWKME